MKTKKQRTGRMLLGSVLAVVIALTAGCGNAATSAGEDGGKLRVTTTIGMLTDVVKEVGGEHVAVTGIMPSGVDPHMYKASQGDIAKFEGAEIIFYNGLHLEGKMTEVFEQMAKQKPTVAVAESIEESSLIQLTVEGEIEYDPHVWFDVKLWMKTVETVRDELVSIDPEHADDYRANAGKYLEKLEELDTYVRENIAMIPSQQRVLVTAHDAFNYFGKAYDIEVRGLQGISTASEAGSKDVTDLRDYLVSNKIKAVFVESSVSDRSIKAVMEGAEKLGHKIKLGGELFSDAMGEEATVEGTYIGMVRHNVDTIVNALK